MKKLIAIGFVVLLVFLAGCAEKASELGKGMGKSTKDVSPPPIFGNEQQPQTGSANCAIASSIQMNGIMLFTMGVEDYKSEQFEGKTCHLVADVGDVTADFYLDDAALRKFQDDSLAETGSGCILLSIKDTASKSEMCFGEKVKMLQ